MTKNIMNSKVVALLLSLSSFALSGCAGVSESHHSDWLENMPKHSQGSEGNVGHIKGLLGERIYN